MKNCQRGSRQWRWKCRLPMILDKSDWFGGFGQGSLYFFVFLFAAVWRSAAGRCPRASIPLSHPMWRCGQSAMAAALSHPAACRRNASIHRAPSTGRVNARQMMSLIVMMLDSTDAAFARKRVRAESVLHQCSKPHAEHATNQWPLWGEDDTNSRLCDGSARSKYVSS